MDLNNQLDDCILKTELLWKLAENDEVYLLWNANYEKYKKRFDRIKWFLPKKLVRFFCEYMDYNAARLNRMIFLACMRMELKNDPRE